MTKLFGWKFEESESGDVEGFNDGYIETFRADHLLSLGKEGAQNSLDARHKKDKPVILEFNIFYIGKKEFPDLETYKEIIDLQIQFHKKARNDKSPLEFFKSAKEIVESEKIRCLRISDFNTTGLDGSRVGQNNPYSNWWKLVRSKGVSDNKSSAGGSFGIGKFANFACSKLRTVFYSTMDLEGVESHQGVSIQSSYDNKEGKRTRGRGYYCKLNDFSCLEGPLNLDNNFKREVPGTDIYILGLVDSEKDLEDKIFSSILSSFLLAIYDGNLIFKFNGKSLEKDTLDLFIDKYRDNKYREFIPQEIIEYYDIINNNLEFKEFKFKLFEKDDVNLKVAIKPGLSNKVGRFRNNGMKIFEKKIGNTYSDFVGILRLVGSEVNSFFRKMENPQHDNWEPGRAESPSIAKTKINKLNTFIKESLKKLENELLPDSENIEGIDSLTEIDFKEEGLDPIEGLDFKPLKIRESTTTRKPKNKIKISIGDGGDGKGKVEVNEKGTSKGSSGQGKNDNKNAIMEIIPKNTKLFQDKSGFYNLIFSFPESSEATKCEVFIGGEEFNEKVDVKQANITKENKELKLQSKDNEIELGNIEKNSKYHIKFKLKKEDRWALEVKFYENS